MAQITLDDGHQIVFDNLDIEPGRFFSSGTNLTLGAGQLYSGVRFPMYFQGEQKFRTARGIVYVLTHECDIDQANQRAFNTHVLICPVIKFEEWLPRLASEYTDVYVQSFLPALAKRDVSRVAYIPAVSEDLPYGGLLYLNTIANTHVEQFSSSEARRIASVTSYGLAKLDHILHRHLFRPKAERLAFAST